MARNRRRGKLATTGGAHIASVGGLSVTGTGDSLAVNVNVSELDTPRHSYSANWVDVSLQGIILNFTFGSVIPYTQLPSSLLTIAYSVDSFRLSYERAREFHQGLRKLVGEMFPAAEPPTVSKDLLATTPPKHLLERATFDIMSYNGPDAEIAFYYLSPNELQVLKNMQRLRKDLVRPVVSVLLGTPLLLAMLDSAVSHLEGIQEPEGES